MKKKHIILLIILLPILILIGIFIYLRSQVAFLNEEEEKEIMTYKQITMAEAKEIFAADPDGSYIILDVRRADEFAEGHIPGAINVANESIGAEEINELPDKAQIIYVYCRSGRRSKEAAGKLAALGYTNIIEFGGIIDWDGPVEK